MRAVLCMLYACLGCGGDAYTLYMCQVVAMVPVPVMADALFSQSNVQKYINLYLQDSRLFIVIVLEHTMAFSAKKGTNSHTHMHMCVYVYASIYLPA